MKTQFAYRTGRTLLVLAVILFLASSMAVAGEKKFETREKNQQTVVVIIKTAPVKTLKSAVAQQGNENKNVPYILIQSGVELFKRSLRWIKKDGSKQDTWVLFFRRR